MTTAVAKNTSIYKPDEIPSEWVEILRQLPGYDPIATAKDSFFNAAEAQRALDFFPQCLRHVEGELAGKPFVLQPWQKAIVANLFGWQKIDSYGRRVRRFREAFILVPRKNGKSPLSAGISLVALFLDKMKGKQCYLAAGDRAQAGIVFRHCKGMVEQEPLLKKRCRVYGGGGNEYQTRSIVREEEGSFLRVISADADSKHGGNTYLAVVDELHVQPNRDLVDTLTTSMASVNVPQPLMVYLTTSDYERVSICNEKHDYARKVRDGLIEDEAFLPVVYEALIDEDWTSPDVWAKSNPNLGVSVSVDYLQRECQHAQEVPAFQNTFMRLHLNIRTQQDTRAIDMDRWDKCGRGVDAEAWRKEAIERLRGQRCAGGLDLGAVSDLTAFVLLFGDDSTGYELLPWFWCPRDSASERERRHRVPYLAWGRMGYLSLTEGNETDYQQVRREIGELCDQFGVHEIAADRLFQGAQLCQDLMRDGLNVTAFGQGYASMAAPTRRILELISGGKLQHGNNPILRWMAGNAATESEARGKDYVLKFSKDKSSEKIDGIIAATMTVGVAMRDPGDVGNWYTPGSLNLMSEAN